MSSTRNFRHLLEARWREGKHLCVGLDPIEERILKSYRTGGPRHEQFVLTFLERIVDATKDVAAAFKPNRAFFRGAHGAETLKKLIEHIQIEAPEIPVILDCKVGDIGASNEGYIAEMFDYFDADAITVHSYLGGGSWGNALNREDKGVFFLCRTSNDEATELQELIVNLEQQHLESFLPFDSSRAWRYFQDMGWPVQMLPPAKVLMPLYEYVALRAQYVWNNYYNAALVVGATAPTQLARVRAIAPDLPLLIPGVGKQGGNVEEVVRAANDKFVINSSSDILYAFEKNGEKPDVAAVAKARELHDQITACLGVPA